MGVPKFFRYISERYPCLSEFIKEYQIPVFDNLYLDMNGIIHMCSHPDDNNPHFRITEEKIFADIFHYIEVLFRMIKPQKVFFMAVDGVAPRAKMNQQRGRRFRSAKDAEKLEAEALKKGEKLPDVGRFDSNCITPGTEFMARLHEQLKYFVVHKVSTDKMWKKCKVILSGHETPGEGEHKIMDYIRYIRAQPGYDPNTRHCLYGLDADLIMLGLCTHEPHFSLLREEVKFGRKTKRTNVPEEIRFYLLHLSLMREYLELEFAPLKGSLTNSDHIKFDIEKIIDDWILMGFLVGNDFIPSLPNLHIANGALPVLYQAYIEVLPTLDGYINEEGTLNLERFEKFMKKLSDIDVKNFEETQADMMYFEKKTGRKHPFHTPVQGKPIRTDNDGVEECKPSTNSDLAALIAATDELDISSEDESDKSSSTEDEQFKSFKDEYYRNKLEYQKVTPEVMREQAEGYVRAIQWNLNYYYNGVCSWSWFYPHHYSPYISDIRGFSNLKIDFELGKPFKPYEQLLAVLPTASKNLLPKCYHTLMTDDSSIIKSYYPEEFLTDLNGKRQEWEAVVLVPFIDENILLEAMAPCNALLTPEEVRRNEHGPMLVYEYTEEDLGIYEAPEYFPSLRSQARCTPIHMEDIRVQKDWLVKGAYPGAHFDVYYPGFPTMKHLKYEGRLVKAKIKVFEMPSRNENMILKLLPNELYFGDSVPLDLLGKTVWVAWPHLVEAKVAAVSNRKQRYTFCEDESKKYRIEDTKIFESELEGVTQHYKDRLGIDFGKTTILVHVHTMIGRKYVFSSNRRVTLEKQFSQVLSHYPLQSVVTDISTHDELYSTFTDIADVFPTDCSCFSLTQPYYGSQGVILDSNDSLKNNQLKVSLTILPEPNFVSALKIHEKLKNSYQNLTISASQVAMSNYVFSRITGSLYISTRNSEGCPKSVNIGLDLKFNKKNQETPGYTRKLENTWFYTSEAVSLVREYVEKFPEVFDYLARSDERDIVADALFGADTSDEKVKEIQTWLKTLPIHNIERRVCSSCVLEPEVIAEIEKILDQMDEAPKNIVMQIKPHLLYKPEIQSGNIPPDPLTRTKVFDRVINVREGFTVPLGLKGTVIGVYKSSDSLKADDEMYDIVFDKTFPGGMALNCSEHRGYRLPKTSFINLSYGKRQMEQKTGIPGALRALAKEKRNGTHFNGNASNNPRQQNSAFASFNRMQPNLNPTPTYNNKYNPVPSHSRQQQQTNRTPDQQKVKSSFYYMADFSPSYDPKVNKENSINKKKTETIQNKPTTKVPPTFSGKPANSKPRTEVNTDFLRQMLNLDMSANNANKTKTAPQQNEVARNAKPSVPPANERTPRIYPTSSGKRDLGPKSASASARLLSYYQSNALGCPRYTYFEEEVGVSAQVVLPNGKVIGGKGAKSREEASENVALDALNLIQNNSQGPEGLPSQFPVPPVNWMERQPNKSSQVFVNKSHQTKQHQKVNLIDCKKDVGPNFSKSHSSIRYNLNNTMNVNAAKFVPLQALKKRQTQSSRIVSNVNRSHQNSQITRQEKRDGPKNFQNDSSNRVQDLDARDRLERSARPRKTRIAANFNK